MSTPRISINAPRFGYSGTRGAVYADTMHICINEKVLHYTEAPNVFSAIAQKANSAEGLDYEFVHGLLDPIAQNEWFTCEWSIYIENPYTPQAHYLVAEYDPNTGEYITQEYKPLTDYMGIATGEYIVSDHSTASFEYLDTLEPVPLPSTREEILHMVRESCKRGGRFTW